ncbi:hypothetical protein GGR52DRAFT_568634 [Hypoxylon sp. FL1284]|nr:hypothetical protein GGR52DRAFT_568634 [Hypoxylon sp. FL1284]
MSLQDRARSLAAVGSAKLPSNEGNGLYLLSVRDGNLVEKFWVGQTVQNETVIASNARNDTSASYLLGLEGEPRRVFYIDQDSTIQCCAYDEDTEEWEETPMGSNWSVITCPGSKLSAVYGPKGEVVVSYQNKAGQLAGIMSTNDDEWEEFGPLEGSPVVGTPQCLEVMKDRLHLFYAMEDGGIGFLVSDPDMGAWQDNLLMKPGFDNAIENFSIAHDPETGLFQAYFLSGGSLWNADGEKEKRHGNGFFINVPNSNFDVILTAGHNLVDKPQQYCANIRIIRSSDEILVTPNMVRVCERYFNEPEDNKAIYDYGVILLERSKRFRMRGFGFNLMLGLAPPLDGLASSEKNVRDILQDATLYVSGYSPEDSPADAAPLKSEGRCIRLTRHDLAYEAHTVQGMSGGPVWMGFRGEEMVVAIHNYGMKSGEKGNRGSRLNLNAWRAIFEWVEVGWYEKSLHYRGFAPYSMHLHMRQFKSAGEVDGEGRVRVGRPGLVETLFDILPVAARPEAKEVEAKFGFILRPKGPGAEKSKKEDPTWVRWNPRRNQVSLTKHFDAHCEVKLRLIIDKANDPFMIQVQDGDSWKMVQMSMGDLDEGDLELLDNAQSFEDTSGISFVPTTTKKLFELR